MVESRDILEGVVDTLKRECTKGPVYERAHQDAINSLREERANSQTNTASLTQALQTSSRERDEILRRLRQCRNCLESKAVDLERAAWEISAMRGRATAFADQLDATLLRVVELEQTVAKAMTEQAGIVTQLHTLENIGRVTEAELRAEIEALRDDAHILRQSTSWRITRPLRALRRSGRTLRMLFGGSVVP